MEPRQLLATFVVTGTSDAGPGSLREAIERANAEPGPDTITFEPGLRGAIELVSPLPDLSTEIELVGPGASVLSVARIETGSTPLFRIVTVPDSGVVSISGLTLTGGVASVGGGVENAGRLTLSGVTIAGNRSIAEAQIPFDPAADQRSRGGGVSNSGTLSIVDSAIVDNEVLLLSFADADGGGGGVENSGILSIERSRFEGNEIFSSAMGSSGGTGNASGGAVLNSGTLSIVGATFLRNIAESPSSFHGSGEGGAISNSGVLTIVGSTFEDNRAFSSGLRTATSRGGAIQNSGVLSVMDSTFAGNRASGTSSFVSGSGGAIENAMAGTTSLTNSTVSGNFAVNGGGISNVGGLRVVQGTVAGNLGDGIENFGTLELQGSILQDDGEFSSTLVTDRGQVTSIGNNLFSDVPDVSLSPTDLVGVDPLLAPLADYGGPTMTHALLPGSPAIDAAAPIDGISTDQRGIPRPQGPAPDIGAFELVVAEGPGRLRVVNVARSGFHARPTTIALTFEQPLDPQQAGLVANYRLFGPGAYASPGVRPGRPIRLRSASFDAATNTVTITSAQPLRLLGGNRFLVTVDDAVRPGGTPGTLTDVVVGAEDFVPSPALSRALLQVQRLQRFRDGTGRLR